MSRFIQHATHKHTIRVVHISYIVDRGHSVLKDQAVKVKGTIISY